ncbi:MAG: hypothetical protein CM15mP25_1140 [Gammaproteobacteria bacterium]|nr:MAG: hypothetical protein CM15mP25_1140 [Gammaproteobacteria bacterium]
MFGTGGKACHLLELQPAIEELVALDISEAPISSASLKTPSGWIFN